MNILFILHKVFFYKNSVCKYGFDSLLFLYYKIMEYEFLFSSIPILVHRCLCKNFVIEKLFECRITQNSILSLNVYHTQSRIRLHNRRTAWSNSEKQLRKWLRNFCPPQSTLNMFVKSAFRFANCKHVLRPHAFKQHQSKIAAGGNPVAKETVQFHRYYQIL